MANKISDETLEYVGILAKLELSEEEREAARSDMEKMLDYILPEKRSILPPGPRSVTGSDSGEL